ncbi:MAG: DUF167 domain-containing protein [Candidatus Omnitrophica bacterium]|nr:DUF167 domain-containing protein [Candidatus Omnitrophota bacterium]
MFISVKVITSASVNQIIQQSKGEFLVKLVTARERGKANRKLLDMLAEYFKVPKSAIMFVKGKYNSKKILNIKTEERK